MFVQKDFLHKLKDFGLNSYESKIWTALLSRGTSTAGELSDIANVPRSRSYDVLESLEKKGFIVMKLGKPISYMAVPPHEVIERIKKKLEQESQERLDLLEQMKSAKVLEELTVLHEKGSQCVDQTDMTGSIRGRANIHNHLIMMVRNAKKSITLATTKEGLARKEAVLGKHLAKAKQLGVTVRITASSGGIPHFKELEKNAQVKSVSLPSRFCIVDKQEVLFMLMDDSKVHPSYEVGIWVKAEYFAHMLDSVFCSFAGFSE